MGRVLPAAHQPAYELRIAGHPCCTPDPASPMIGASSVPRRDPRIAVCAIVRGQARDLRRTHHLFRAACVSLVSFLHRAVRRLRSTQKSACAAHSDANSTMPSSAVRDGSRLGPLPGCRQANVCRSCATRRRGFQCAKRIIVGCWRSIGGDGRATDRVQRVVAQPPESGMICPGMKFASVARKSARAAVSSGWPRRCAGTTPRMRFKKFSSSVRPGG